MCDYCTMQGEFFSAIDVLRGKIRVLEKIVQVLQEKANTKYSSGSDFPYEFFEQYFVEEEEKEEENNEN